MTLGELADEARRVRGGTDEVYFVQNLYVNQTNVCRVKCKFCAFAATQKQEHAYTFTSEELVEDVLEQREVTGFTEIHMVNGENPHVDFAYYRDTIAALHEALPDVHLKCYTASEIHHMTTLSGLTHEEVLVELKAAGSGRFPEAARRCSPTGSDALVAPGKESPDIWFHVHDTAHALGIPTHCTMLYGHVETYEERVDHILRLRDQQDRSGGFLAFIPLAFHPENTVFERRGWRHTTGADDLKMLAFSRLMLDNIPNIKAYWIMMGMPLAAIALHFGANDVQGTVVREQIFHAAGAPTETEQKIDELRALRARGGPDPRSARHPLQRAPALGMSTPKPTGGTPIWVWVVYSLGIFAAAIFVFSILFTAGATSSGRRRRDLRRLDDRDRALGRADGDRGASLDLATKAGSSDDPARAHLVREHGARLLRARGRRSRRSPGVPTELSRMLLAGELDIAPIPSIEYARNADRYRILPRLCVSSEGAVDSIQLVTRLPFGQVRSVAVTPESATSVVLVRILLPNAEIVPLGMEADATLLIGDAALRSAFEDPTPHFDLGRLWLERTGLPMVFAVWAAPEPVADGLIELEHALVASVRLARSEPERLATQASEAYGYPPGFLARYFEKLRYSFGPRERAGLYTFLEMARDAGELDHVPELRFVREEVRA